MENKRRLHITLILIVFIVGMLLRVHYFNITDMNGLEITKVSKIEVIGYEISKNLYEFVFIAFLIVIALALTWWRKSALLLASFFLLAHVSGIMDTAFTLAFQDQFHPHPPLFRIFISSLQVVWRLLIENNILTGWYNLQTISVMPSFISTIAIPIVGYILCKKIWDKETAYITFLLLMLSPYLIFFSGFAGATEPATFLIYLALLLFIMALRGSEYKYFFLSGLIFSIAISIRYTVLLLVPIFFLLCVFSGKIDGHKPSKSDVAIFLVFIFGTIILYSSHITESYYFMSGLEAKKGGSHMYARDVPRFASYYLDYFGGSPIKNSPLLYFHLTSLFYSPIALIIVLIAIIYSIFSKDFMMQIFTLIFIGYVIYHSLMVDQMIRYFNDLIFPLVILSARIIALIIKRFEQSKDFILTVFTLAFMIFSASTVGNLLQEPFKGLTGLIDDLGTSENISFLINDNSLAYYLIHSDMKNVSFNFIGDPQEFSIYIQEKNHDFIVMTRVFGREISFEALNEKYFNENGYRKYKDLFTGRYLVYEVYHKKKLD